MRTQYQDSGTVEEIFHILIGSFLISGTFHQQFMFGDV